MEEKHSSHLTPWGQDRSKDPQYIVSNLQRPAFAMLYELNLIHYLNSLGTKYTLPENMTIADQIEVLTDNPGGML